MNTDHYFAFYGIPLSFDPDPVELKRLFLQNSKRYHPDFFTLDNEEAQAKALEMATLNNETYRVLSDPDRRMQYILQIYGMAQEGDAPALPQEFLMDMMDINESLMEWELAPDPEQIDTLRNAVDDLEKSLFEAVRPSLQAFNEQPGASALQPVLEYYLKKRYLLRIKEKIATFASVSDI